MYIEVRGKCGVDEVARALKLFSKMIKKEGVLAEVFARQEYSKPSKKRKMKESAARQRKIRDEIKSKKIASR